jgi:serpin B
MLGARRPAIQVAIIAAMLSAMPRAGLAEEQSGVRALTRAYNASGQVLFRQFSTGNGNIVFSPYSIGTAMAMVLAGTRGETEREMAAALQHRLVGTAINDANAAALATLKGYDRSKVPPTCPQAMLLKGERCEARPGADGQCMFLAHRIGEDCVASPRFAPSAKLLVANALMLSAGAPVAADYAGLLRNRYAAEVFAGAGADTVNGWVKERTEGKIERIVEKMSDLMLVNAVYFKSRWALPFNKRNTRPEFFNLSRTRQEMVETMLQRTLHAVVAREGYRAIRLPYAVRSLAMVIALPNEVDGLNEVAQRLDRDELAGLRGALTKAPPRQVVLMLPRFRAEFTADLIEPFRHAGLTLAFDRNRSDFSAMTGKPPASAPTAIDQIVHRAVIEVSEESTEAAAATSIGISVASAPPPPEPLQFRVDRPFLYFLVDDATGAVLFQGRVVDPR